MEGSRTVEGMTPEENAEVQRIHEVILKAMDREIWQLAQFMVTRRDDQLFGAAEFDLAREGPADGGPSVGSDGKRPEKKGYQGSSTVCPDCGQDARFLGWRTRTVVSLVGPITVSAAYYHCRALPSWPQALGACVATQTDHADAGRRRDLPLAGVLGSFADGAERVLQKMSGLHLSESTIERTTEAAGERVAKRLEAGKSLGPTNAVDLAERRPRTRLRVCEPGRHRPAPTRVWRYARGREDGLRGDGLQRA